MTKEQFTFIFDTSFEIRTLFRNVSLEVANFIACQSALETAYGTSQICRFNQNIFGMKFPRFRVTTAFRENRGHALYCDAQSSIIDYFLWLQMSGFNIDCLTDLSAFRSRLEKSNYNARRSQYVEKIVSIYETYKSLYDNDTYMSI